MVTMSITMGLHLYVAVILITIGQIWAQMPPMMQMPQGSPQMAYMPEECLKLFPGGAPMPIPSQPAQPGQPAQTQYPAMPPPNDNIPPSPSPPSPQPDSPVPFVSPDTPVDPPDGYQEEPEYPVPPPVVPPAGPDDPPPESPPSLPQFDGAPKPDQPSNPNIPNVPGDGNMLCMDTRYLSMMDPKFMDDLNKLYQQPPAGLPPMQFTSEPQMPNNDDMPFETQMPPAGSVKASNSRRYVPVPMAWPMGYPQWGGPTFAYPLFYKKSPKEKA